MVDQPVDFVAKLAELRARQASESGEPPLPQQPPGAENYTWDDSADLSTGRTKDEDELDAIISRIDAVTAYNKWIGKSRATGGKKDGNMISCPFPNHPDRDPSAWINTEDNTWFCGGCEQGGDVYDLAAIHFNYPIPGYKDGQTFHKLREQMAESFGWRIKRLAGGAQLLYQETTNETTPPQVPAPQASAPPAVQQPVQPTPPPAGDPGLSIAPSAAPAPDPGVGSDGGAPQQDEANVAHMWADQEDGAEELVLYPTINWRGIIREDTFLHEYMKACCNDDSPEEYHFWHGLLALGHAVGRQVTLDDHRPVYGNLMVCLLGATGIGKSRSRGWLDTVLRETLPYAEDGTATRGVKIVAVPGSGEYLVSAFSYEGKDPANGKASLGYQSVNGIVDFDELSALLTRANRDGSSLKPTIMALADARNEVKVGSLTRGDYVAKDPFCSITASTQPRAIRTLLNRTDTSSGFLNRWVFAGGKEKEIEVLGGNRASTSIDLSASIALLKNVRGWGAIQRSIQMDDDAYDLYVSYFRTILEPTKRNDETDLLKRVDLMSKKLMLLLAINERRTTVSLQNVETMIPLMEYVIECFGILNSNIGVTVMQDVMNEILRHIARHEAKTGRGASARDIARYTHRKNYTLEQIKKALDIMGALDMIELEKKEKAGPGRPTARWSVVGGGA